MWTLKKSIGAITLGLAAQAYAEKADLSTLSLHELTATEVAVTSVAKRPERLSESAAAIYVISREDIRRSGVTNIPDALRMAPGVQVAQIDSNHWAVAIRGFNSANSNKLLVLIDGRIVYNPLFALTYWSAQDVLLEDIDRIEVIRGPGATLWGSNAVNGVINIITLPAKETQGNLATALTGKHENNTFSFRHGGQGKNLFYRFYGKTFQRDRFTNAAGIDSVDNWAMSQFGFRSDWKKKRDSFTFQGDYYDGEVGQLSIAIPEGRIRDPYTGSNLMARWTRTYSPVESLSIQAYYDRTERDKGIALVLNTNGFHLGERRENYDLELQYNLEPAPGHAMILGASARRSKDAIEQPNPLIGFKHRNTQKDLFSVYVQDEISFSKRFRLILGSKLEHNDFSGWETQPTARALYLGPNHQTFWAAASRAVRIPTRVDTDLKLSTTIPPPPIPILVNFEGNEDFKSEVVKSYELGYRISPSHNLSFDLTAFYADYKELETIEALPLVLDLSPPPKAIFGFMFGNKAAGKSRGAELSANWTVSEQWRLTGSYTYCDIELRNLPGSTSPMPASAGESPKNQYQLRSSMNFGSNVEFDTMLYYVDGISVPNYTRVDLRLGWQIKPNVNFSLTTQNLSSGRHAELLGPTSTYITPATFGKLVWKF